MEKHAALKALIDSRRSTGLWTGLGDDDWWNAMRDEDRFLKEADRMNMASLTSAMMAGNHPPSGFESQEGLLRAISQRLRVTNAGNLGFDFIAAHKAAEKVFVFAVVDGNPVTLEDEWGLFPTDKLITALRLLKQEKK